MYKILMKKTEQTKKGNRWINTNIEDYKEIKEDEYENMTSEDTIRFFRCIGGYERAYRNYTFKGYVITNLYSISPDRSERIIRDFKFVKIID